MAKSLLNFFKKLSLLIFAFFFTKYALADVQLFTKSSIGPEEPLKIYLKISSERKNDVYVVVYRNGRFFSLRPGNQIAPGILPYGSYQNFEGPVLEITFYDVPSELEGEYLLFAGIVPKGADPLTYNFDSSELQVKSLVIRSAFPRKTGYLNQYLQKIEENDRAYIYGLYGARLLSVYHPEIYLQADDLFLRFLFRIEGSSWFYDRDPASMGAEEYLEKPGQPSFSMSMVNLGDYESVRDFEVYPEPVPFLNWLDRRVAPIHLVLKARKKFSLNPTHLEKAFLLYFYKKYTEQKNASRLFVIYALDGSAYVYDHGQIFDLDNRSLPPASLSKPLVLIFNEKSVWFPLMGRDDSDIDPNLAQVLSLLAPGEGLFAPILSNFEKGAVNLLKEKTRLKSLEEKDFAKYVAINADSHLLYYGYNRLGIFPRTTSLPADAILNWRFHLRIFSSALSPFSDYLAQILKKNGYPEFSRCFLAFNQWGGETVSIDTSSYTIDVGFRANVGTCKDLSVYAAASLEAAQKYWVRIHGVIPNPEASGSHLSSNYPHFYVYVPEDEAFIDNGRYGDGRAYGLKYVWGGIPGKSGIPTRENFSIDIINTPKGFAIFHLAGTPPNYEDSRWHVFGSFSEENLLNLLQNIYQESQPKPLIAVYEPSYHYVVSAIPFEEGLKFIPRYYRRLHIP